MIRRSTWIFFAVFVILLLVAIYLNRSGALDQEEQATLPTPRPQLVAIEAGLLRQVELESAQGEEILLDKNAQGTWQLLEPAGMQLGASTALESAINAISSLQAISTLESKIAIEVIGLSPPSYTLTLRSNDGREEVLGFGSKTPTGSGYYVQDRAGSIFVVSTFNVESVLKLLSDPTILVTPTVEGNETPEPATPGAGMSSGTPTP